MSENTLNIENALDFDGLKHYDIKNKQYIEEKLSNIQIDIEPTYIKEFEGELTVNDWVGNTSPYTQTVIVDELPDYNNCNITLSPSATEEQMYTAALAEINDISYDESNNTITFIANGIKPTITLPFTVCAGNAMNVVEMPNYLGEDIPTNHASSETTYGAGTSVNYGHVKVSDNYKVSDGTASAGVVASSKAVADAYNEMNSNLSNLFKQTITVQENVTINANDIKTIYMTPIVPTGYRYLCPIGYALNNRYVAIYNYTPGENQVMFGIRNIHSSAITITINLYALCILDM